MSTAAALPRRLMLALVALVAAVALLPAATAGASGTATYGGTTLALDSGAAGALTSLGVTPGVVGPATAGASGLRFPIVNSFGNALVTRSIRHSGSISLTKGATVVKLTDFNINLGFRPDLTAKLGAARASILDLDFRGSRIGFADGGIRIGPVKATLTQGAADALNGAFGVTAFTKGLLLGKATVNYSLFPRY